MLASSIWLGWMLRTDEGEVRSRQRLASLFHRSGTKRRGTFVIAFRFASRRALSFEDRALPSNQLRSSDVGSDVCGCTNFDSVLRTDFALDHTAHDDRIHANPRHHHRVLTN